MTTRPTYFIRSYGCQMNSNDTERLSALLGSVGFDAAENEESANLVVFNTCSVREHAEQRIYGMMERLMERKRAGDDLLIAVTGCMAGRDKDGVLRKRLSMVDLFFATPEMVQLPRWIAELKPEWSVGGDVPEDYLHVHPGRHVPGQAFVTIQTGCNQFCSYCVVPYARGLERNRPVSHVLEELRRHIEDGIRDVIFLGQAVNAYKASDPGSFSPQNPYTNHFAALLWEANQMAGIERIHWTAAHPLCMDAQVIHALSLPKQVNYLHLPVQAGSDEVLRRMNRKYTRTQFLDIIGQIKASRPGIALGTDIIVGFSGETQKDFEETLDLYRTCDFDISYPAQYSPRTGTLSHRLFADDVTAEDKKARWQGVQDLMEEIALRKNQAYLGKTVRVFVERTKDGVLTGTNDELKTVTATGAQDSMLGTFVDVSIEKPLTWILQGKVVPHQAT